MTAPDHMLSSAPPAPRSHRRKTPAPPTGPGTGHITALDGLRGLAVLGVLLFHAGHLGGGFLGVDLFFVLSGFLITGLLLKEARARDGRIDLAAFWGRRARRLLPALAAVIAGTLILAWAFGTPQLQRQALDDAPWVMANLANWHYIADQAGYWQSSQTQVFSHLWSIAVEEQFYLLWPLLLVLLVRFGKGSGERLVAAAALTGALLSLALMIMLVEPVDTTRVYEGTDTRAFSLLLGSLAATAPAVRLVRSLGRRARAWWSPALAGGIAAYWLTADGQDAPGLFHGGLFLHALAAALLIACLAHTPHGPVARALSAAPLRGLGLISYSLYLWHWPVFLLLTEDRLGLTGWSRTAVLLGTSLLAALLTKLLVEDPIRFRARWAHGRTGTAALLAALVALISLWALLPRPQPGADTVDITRLTVTAPR
ncbi:acyltransferase [Streptomyces sp. HNM0663]|uniref:Acyltransferase n=1 Tax=Streptomyces chengmaiensis TaxID=3040919 RepID=A0ABT6HF62_9ACTN|nr:acyltransferase [Streptomyces chengmaiensis]MDH2387404.1 acyltransferase [Streptomyces chengmaiensis]